MRNIKIVWTVGGLSRGKIKKGSKKLVRKVVKNKKFRRALKKEGIRSRETLKTVAKTTVGTVLANHEVIERRPTALQLYAELWGRMTADPAEGARVAQKREKERTKKLIRVWKKRGGKYDPKSGLVKLLKAEKLPKLKKAKPNKPRKK